MALTASAFEHERDAILSCGADDFVAKPFRERTIFEKLSEHLGVRYAFDEAPEGGERDAAADALALTAERVAALPARLLDELRKAVVAGDMEEVARVAEAVRPSDESLADALLAKVHDYKMDDLFALLDRVEPGS